MTPKETDENACCSDLRAMMAQEASSRVKALEFKCFLKHFCFITSKCHVLVFLDLIDVH